MKLTWDDGTTKEHGTRMNVEDENAQNQNENLNNMIEGLYRFSPAKNALSKSEVINIVSKALVQDIAWEVETGGRDCFIGVADDSRF